MDIEKLAERAKEKDPHAIDALYRMYFPKMLGLCIKITKADEDTAKDLVHDAFVLAFSSLQSLNSPERFGEWLTSIVRNVALKYLEKEKRMSVVSLADADETLADKAASPDVVAEVHDILHLIDLLPDGYGRVFRLFVINGYSHKEIADILGIKPHSSSSQLTRAKAMLRKMVDRRILSVVLLMAMAVSLYVYVFREKSLQSDKPEMAKENVPHGMPEPVGEEPLKPMPAPERTMAVSRTVQERPDTSMQMRPDTAGIVEVAVPDEVLVAENDSVEPQPTDSLLPSSFDKPADYELAMKQTRSKKKRWHMLAAGSLGPALAQNIYRLVAVHNPDDIADADAPTVPIHVKTWEEYSDYLHSKDQGSMPKDSMALMEIADHNHGDIVEREQHDRPITFGLSLSKTLSERWDLETGLQYSMLKSRSIAGSREYYIKKDQKIHYLGIPLRLSWRFADYKRLSAYGSAGVTLNIPIYGKVKNQYVVDNIPVYTSAYSLRRATPPVQWSTNFGLGVQYRLLPKMSVYVEPTLYWYIPNGSSFHTIWTEHPVTFSVPFGIRITW